MLFDNHKYELLCLGDAEYYVSLYREQRLHRFVDMKQPVPTGAIMGLDLVLKVKYLGRPASHQYVTIFKEDMVVFKGQLDAYGIITGIPLAIDNRCQCVPIGLSNTKEHCQAEVDRYSLTIKSTDASRLTSSELVDANPMATT